MRRQKRMRIKLRRVMRRQNKVKEVEKERLNKEENTRTPVKQKILKWEVAMKGQGVVVAKKAGKIVGKGKITPMRGRNDVTGRGLNKKEGSSRRKVTQQQNIIKYLQVIITIFCG